MQGVWLAAVRVLRAPAALADPRGAGRVRAALSADHDVLVVQDQLPRRDLRDLSPGGQPRRGRLGDGVRQGAAPRHAGRQDRVQRPREDGGRAPSRDRRACDPARRSLRGDLPAREARHRAERDAGRRHPRQPRRRGPSALGSVRLRSRERPGDAGRAADRARRQARARRAAHAHRYVHPRAGGVRPRRGEARRLRHRDREGARRQAPAPRPRRRLRVEQHAVHAVPRGRDRPVARRLRGRDLERADQQPRRRQLPPAADRDRARAHRRCRHAAHERDRDEAAGQRQTVDRDRRRRQPPVHRVVVSPQRVARALRRCVRRGHRDLRPAVHEHRLYPRVGAAARSARTR